VVAACGISNVIGLRAVQAGATDVALALSRIEAEMFSREDRLPRAIAELTTILAGDPRSARTHMLLGAAYTGTGDRKLLGEAIAELREALAIDPSLTQARFYLANAYLLLGRTDRARDEITFALSARPNQPQFLSTLAEAERRLGNPSRAIELTRQALAVDATLDVARLTFARALLEAGESDAGIRELESLVGSEAPSSTLALILGTAYLDADRVADGVAQLLNGLQADPTDLDLRMALARGLRLGRQFDQAERLLMAPRPDNPAMQDPEYARRFDVQFHLELGLLREQQGQFARAAAAFRQVLAAEPGHIVARQHLTDVARRVTGSTGARE
jgi:tetratricopeptide (TPR) repeat protein